MQKLDTPGRLLRWAVELPEFEVEYKPRPAIKAQALADFIVEASYEEEEEPVGVWKLAVDGSAAQTGSGAGIRMTSPEGNVFEYAIKFKASNNEAEYEAAIAGIKMCMAADAKKRRLQTAAGSKSNQRGV